MIYFQVRFRFLALEFFCFRHKLWIKLVAFQTAVTFSLLPLPGSAFIFAKIPILAFISVVCMFQRWSLKANAQGQRKELKKTSRLRPRTGTEMVEVKTRYQGHNFSKLWSANFPLFLSAQVLKILVEFRFF